MSKLRLKLLIKMPKFTSWSSIGNKIPPHGTLLHPLQPISIHCFNLGLFNWQWLLMVMLPRGCWSCWLPRWQLAWTWTWRRWSSLGSSREARSPCHLDHPVIFPSAHLCMHTCPSAYIILTTLTCFPQATANHCFSLGGVMNPSAPWCLRAASPPHTHLFPWSCNELHDLSGIADTGRDSVFMSAHISPFLPGGASSLDVA